MTVARYTITTAPPVPQADAVASFAAEDAYNASVLAEVVAFAQTLTTPDRMVVGVEVAYPGDDVQTAEGESQWDRTGDALWVDLTGDVPQVRTMTSEEWQEASA